MEAVDHWPLYSNVCRLVRPRLARLLSCVSGTPDGHVSQCALRHWWKWNRVPFIFSIFVMVVGIVAFFLALQKAVSLGAPGVQTHTVVNGTAAVKEFCNKGGFSLD